jgi:hypothetical protein
MLGAGGEEMATSSLHEPMECRDASAERSLSGRCRLGEATFAAMGRKEEDAPIPAVRVTTPELPGSTHSRTFRTSLADGGRL